ncbi:hypothetical protein OIO90_004734 [Microbotryomycetes sp. JL221]|nr:hypothetical protein OIO90_004734 [Microbotryomycetes sp. JL221]
MTVSLAWKLIGQDVVNTLQQQWRSRRAYNKTAKHLAVERLIHEQRRQRTISRWVIRCQVQRRHAEEMFQSLHPNAPSDILTNVQNAARAWIDLSQESPIERLTTCRQIILIVCPQHKVRFASTRVRTFPPSSVTMSRSRSSSVASQPSSPRTGTSSRWRSRSSSTASATSRSPLAELPFTITLTPMTRPLFLELAISLLPSPLELLNDLATASTSPSKWRLVHFSLLDVFRLYDHVSPLINVACMLHWLALLDRLFGAATLSTLATPSLTPGQVTMKSPMLSSLRMDHTRSVSNDSNAGSVWETKPHPLWTFATCAINSFARARPTQPTLQQQQQQQLVQTPSQPLVGPVSELQYLDATRLVQICLSHEQVLRDELDFEQTMFGCVVECCLRWKDELEFRKRQARHRLLREARRS